MKPLNKLTFDQRIANWLLRKDILLWALLLTAIFVLKKPLESILSDTLVNLVLEEVKSTWYLDILLYLFIFCTAVIVCARFRNYVPSKNVTVFISLLTLAYLFYRFSSESPWIFLSTYWIDWLAYSDVVFGLATAQIFLLLPNLKSQKASVGKEFFHDEPLGSEDEDLLGYTTYASQISEMILASSFPQAFAIGINGKWGLGKTTFINRIKNDFEGKDLLEIDFNPWNSRTPAAISKDFFDSFQKGIRPYHSSLSRLAVQYANKLVSLKSNTFTESFHIATSALTGYETIDDLHNEINEALKKVNRKIVVYIDDLDRLDKNEIVEVIRLIRNTANFYNTFFVVAYDRNYIVTALKDYLSFGHHTFLEKIFQVEVTLPYFEDKIFRDELLNKLKLRLPAHLHPKLEDALKNTKSIFSTTYLQWIECMRDVTRLANAIILNIGRLEEDVDLKDFIRLEQLRLKYPSVYQLLYRKRDDFLEPHSQHGNKQQYRLKQIEKNQPEMWDGKKATTELEFFLFENHPEMSLPKNEIIPIASYVNSLFRGEDSWSTRFKSHLSVVWPSRFNSYFMYSLEKGRLPEGEFLKARASTELEFKEKIKDWVENGLERELRKRLEEEQSFDGREDFEKIVSVIFYLAHLPSSGNGYLLGEVGFDINDLGYKTRNYKEIATRYYDGDEDSYKSFLLGHFKEAQSPYLFESDVLRSWQAEWVKEFAMSKELMNYIRIMYLRKYALIADSLDNIMMSLYFSCEQTNWIPTGANSAQSEKHMPEQAKEVIKHFAELNDIKGLLFRTIDPEGFNRKLFTVGNIITQLYGDWKGFDDMLNKLNKSDDYIVEYLEFYEKVSSNGYNRYVEFDFNIIPVHQKFAD